MSKIKEETADISYLSSEDPPEEKTRQIKNKYSAERLMMMLDKEKLEALEEEFNDHPDGIELHNFVWLMKCAMSVAPEEKADLVLGLYYLFQEIDINGDEHMEWSEFTQYIIDAVMSQSKDKAEDKALSPAEIMELAQSHRSRRYMPSKLTDRSFHYGLIRHIHFCPSLDLVSVVEMKESSVRLYNLQSEVKSKLSPPFEREAFVLAAAYSDSESIFLVSGSDRCFYVYEKEGNNFRLAKHFKTRSVNTSLWYLPEHKAWMSASEDNALRHWNLKAEREVFVYKSHTSTIMDAIEIMLPFCVATASMDGKIYLWDLNEQKKIGVLSGKHPLGVRQLDYIPDYGGNIVSVGYEREIQVWSPEVSISKCYVGKLEGHNCPVVSCVFFKARPMCVSIDEKGNVRLWDVRQFACLQVIANDKGKIEVTKLITITKYDKFVVAGRRLAWYELHKESSLKSTAQDIVPICAGLNTYYMEFVVVTKYDIRIYDSFNGRLKKIYGEVQDPKTEAELSTFCFDHRHRIFLVGDSSGSIRAYNFSNGAMMREILPENTLGSSQDDWNTEICQIEFCKEDKILISCSWDSIIRIYDLSDSEEVSSLRVMTGGHMGADITALTYSSHLSLIATASSNGIISVWDFEMARLEAAFVGHSSEISNLRFLNKYPVLVSISDDCTVCFWAVRPFIGKIKNKCFARLVNVSWGVSSDLPTSLTCIQTQLEYSEGFQRHKRRTHFKQKKPEFANLKALPQGVEEEDTYEWVENPKVEVIPDNDQNQVKERNYLFSGDSRGYVKIWVLDELFRKHSIFPTENSERNRPSYNPKRRDEKNVESDVKFWVNESRSFELPRTQEPEELILVREWKAHKEPVTCIEVIQEPKSVLTCSGDKTMKLWSLDADLWGCIDLTSPKSPKAWNFPFDWEAKKHKDLEKVSEILSLIGENIDFDPRTLPVSLPHSRKKPRKKPKKPKYKEQFPKRQVKSRLSATPVSDESSEELFIEEKPQQENLNEYSENVTELAKRLREIEERYGISKAESRPKDQSFKKLPKLKKPSQEEIKIPKFNSKIHANPMLSSFAKNPNVKSAALLSKKPSVLSLKPTSLTKALNQKKKPVLLRTAKCTSGDINKIKMRSLKEQTFSKIDMKFRSGESSRLLSRATRESLLKR